MLLLLRLLHYLAVCVHKLSHFPFKSHKWSDGCSTRIWYHSKMGSMRRDDGGIAIKIIAFTYFSHSCIWILPWMRLQPIQNPHSFALFLSWSKKISSMQTQTYQHKPIKSYTHRPMQKSISYSSYYICRSVARSVCMCAYML